MTQPIVVFVTALPVETKSVLAHLEPHIIKRTIRHHEGNCYKVRAYGIWDVVVVEAGKGNPSAGVVTTRALDSTKPKYAFFVGVAGGIKDVKLGDVVIADVVKGYETGKDEKKSSIFSFKQGEVVFKPRGEVGQSADSLVQLAREMVINNQWYDTIKHSNENQNHGRWWDWVTKLISGKNVKPEGKQYPSAQVGTIVAGEKVVAALDSNTYQLIKECYSEAVAIDMEDIGFLKATHASHSVKSIVIRGISDLLHNKSPHNDKRWQRIAAKNAAGFAFAMLDELHFSDDDAYAYERFVGNIKSESRSIGDKELINRIERFDDDVTERSIIRQKAYRILSDDTEKKRLAKSSVAKVRDYIPADDKTAFEENMFDCMRWLHHSLGGWGVARDVDGLKAKFVSENITTYKHALIHIRDSEIPMLSDNEPLVIAKIQEYINILIDRLQQTY